MKKLLTISLTTDEHKQIKLLATQKGISIKALILLAISKLKEEVSDEYM